MNVSVVSIIMGFIVLIVFGFFKRVPNQKKVKGKIYSNEFSHYESDDDGGSNMYYFYVRYIVDGKEYSIRSKYTSSYRRIGSKVIVRYNSEDPEEAVIVDKMIIIFGLIFIVFGIYTICYELIK